ncbi:MAG: hypothetical protein J6Y98_09150 [Bacteroidales bacterium]|nr:hypothetical protein [Bacteroidales bacterium]
MLLWKNKRNGKSAMMIEGARRVGKSYIVKEFAKRQAYHATYGSQALPHHPLFATLIYFNGAHHHFVGQGSRRTAAKELMRAEYSYF